jgi:hypothetical protein
VNGVPGRAQLVCELQEPRCLPLRVVVEHDLGHGGGVYTPPDSRIVRRGR